MEQLFVTARNRHFEFSNTSDLTVATTVFSPFLRQYFDYTSVLSLTGTKLDVIRKFQ